jgi:hypothetical protein
MMVNGVLVHKSLGNRHGAEGCMAMRWTQAWQTMPSGKQTAPVVHTPSTHLQVVTLILQLLWD